MYSRDAEKRMPDLMCVLVRENAVTISDAEWYASYDTEFYRSFEDILGNLYLPSIPLVFDQKHKKFSIMAEFHANCRYGEFEQYKSVFFERFHKAYGEKRADDSYPIFQESEEFEDEVENAEGFNEEFDLRFSYPFKTFDERHIDVMVAKKFQMTDIDTEFSLDNYGWIHNRKTHLYTEMITLAERYRLPRFPIILHEDGKDFDLRATRGECDTYHYLLEERKTILMDLERVIDDSGTGDFQKKCTEKLGGKMLLQKSWDRENRKYAFPSAIGCYPVEIVDEAGLDFQHKTDRLGRRIDFGPN